MGLLGRRIVGRTATGYEEKQKSNKERLLDQMREGKGTYGGKKEAGN